MTFVPDRPTDPPEPEYWVPDLVGDATIEWKTGAEILIKQMRVLSAAIAMDAMMEAESIMRRRYPGWNETLELSEFRSEDLENAILAFSDATGVD